MKGLKVAEEMDAQRKRIRNMMAITPLLPGKTIFAAKVMHNKIMPSFIPYPILKKVGFPGGGLIKLMPE